jgi:Flp pilus assembly protein TadD
LLLNGKALDGLDTMTLSESDIARHNRSYERACHLVRHDIMIDGQPLSPSPGLFARLRLRKALRLFDEVLRMNPENWAAIFFTGKIHHRLGDRVLALELMRKAYRGNPSMAGFAREAGLVASQLGHHQEGIELTEEAIRLRPADGSLYSNLGLMQLLSGAASDAVRSFQHATELEPDHTLTPRLLAVAKAVQLGSVRCPTTESELARAL